MNFGKKIVIVYSIFVLIILTFVIVSSRQNMGLIDKDYYKNELTYQRVINANENYEKLKEKIKLIRKDNRLNIVFPDETKEFKNTKISILRPSDSKKDKSFNLEKIDNNVYIIDNLETGLWELTIKWQTNGLDYFYQKEIYI